jgi:subtilisin family serine protease
MNLKKSLIFKIACAFLCIWIWSCQSPTLPTKVDNQAILGNQAQMLREKFLRKKPVTNPVEIYLSPHLLNVNGGPQTTEKIREYWVQSNSPFQIKSTEEKVVFVQSTPVSTEPQSYQWPINIPESELSLRYKIVLTSSSLPSPPILTLNGVKVSWTSEQSGVYSLTKVLLTQNTQIGLWIQGGDLSSHVELKVLAYDSGGTEFRRQQISNFKSVDTIFQQRLKELATRAGDLHITNGGVDLEIAAFQFNHQHTLYFESDAVILRFREGNSADLGFYQEEYGAKLVDEMDGFYKLQVDLSRAPVERLPELIDFVNRGLPENIESISFSSLKSMQLFSIITDILHRQANAVASVELNLYNPQIPAYYPIDGSYLQPVYESGKQVESWWLSKPHVNEAWDHSIGTGVTVAWIDRGFKPEHPEIRERLLKNKDNPKLEEENRLINGGLTLDAALWHGHYALMAGFAERDNIYKGLPLRTVGVAPNVRVIPYAALLSWEYAASVRAAINHGADVIGFNQSWEFNQMGTFFQAIAEYGVGLISVFGGGPDYVHVQIPRALERNIPVIFSAHNYYKPISEFSPINENINRDIIVVGAVRPTEPTPQPSMTPMPTSSPSSSPTPPPVTVHPPLQLHATWNINVTDGKYGQGTNYGPNMVWAPGEWIDVALSVPDSSLRGLSGTSFAAPQVAAVVALIKSRNPQLTPKQIKDVLLDNSVSIHSVKGHPKMASAGLGTVRMLDALEALKKTGSTPAIQTWTGVIRGTGTARWIELNRLLDGTASLQEKVMTIPRQTVAKEIWDNNMKDGSFVVLQGWSNVKAGEFTFGSGEIEVRNVNKLCDLNTCPSTTPASHKPSLQSIIVPAGSAANIDVKIELKGDNLWLDTNFTNLREGELLFKEVDPTTGADIVPSSAPIQYVLNDLTRLTNTKNDGKGLIVNLPANTLMSGKFYKLAFKGLTGQSSFIGATSVATQGFALTAEGTNLPFSLLSAPGVAESPDSYAFEQIKLHGAPGWIQPNVRIPVEPNQFVGIRFNQPINDLKVQVGPIEVPVVSLLKDFAAIGIPEELPAGIHDVILRSTNGVITLEQAVEKVAVAYPPRPEHTPPPTANPGEYSTIYLGNVEGNDEARAYLNDQLVATAHAGDNLYVNIGSSSEDFPLSQEHRNTIRFELENRGGGYTYRFGICGSHEGTCVFGDENGVAGSFNVRNADGEEDTRTGIVYRESIQLYRFAKPMGLSDQPFWYKVFNLPSGSEIRLDNGGIWEQTFVGGAGEKSGAIPMSGDVKQAEENPGHFMLDNCTYFSDTWVNYGVSGHWQGPDAAPASYGIELYRGIHRIFRQVVGQATYPQSVDRSLSLGQQILNWKTSAYANFYPPNGFWHGSICY